MKDYIDPLVSHFPDYGTAFSMQRLIFRVSCMMQALGMPKRKQNREEKKQVRTLESLSIVVIVWGIACPMKVIIMSGVDSCWISLAICSIRHSNIPVPCFLGVYSNGAYPFERCCWFGPKIVLACGQLAQVVR